MDSLYRGALGILSSWSGCLARPGPDIHANRCGARESPGFSRGECQLFTVFILDYGTKHLGFPRGDMLNGVMVASACSLFTVPLWGYLSDRFGRKRVYLFGCVALGVWIFAYFALLDTKVPWMVFLAVILAMPVHDIQYGPQAALIAESFTGRLRYSGASLGYQLASITAGGPAPLIALALLQTFQSSTAIAVYVAIAAAISFVATALLPDRSHHDLTQEYEDLAPTA